MFDEFLTNQNSWLNQIGPSSEIIFSSRIRLARNLSSYPFPVQATKAKKEAVLDEIKEVYPAVDRLKESVFVQMQDLDELDREFLLERHLISQEHTILQNGKGLIVSSDERIAVMINEEDHLRMQVVTCGFDLGKCWEALDKIDDQISEKVNFAFMPDLGYLTSCPTNVGTALRVSCMLRLPALVLTKRINKIMELLAKISFTTRGFFGEGTAAYGDFFQISNQVCLGVSETELIDNLVGVVNQIKEQEVDARNYLMKKHKFNIEDNVWRALGILRNCRLINSKEALNHLSMLSLGLDLGIIKGIRKELVNSLFIIIQPAHLQKIEGKLLKEGERDYIRAEIIREKLQ
jgi:protein arginine kinase